MKCQQCGEREAAVHLKHVVEGQTTELHLCDACAADRGIEPPGPPPLGPGGPGGPLGGFLNSMWQGVDLEEADLVPGGACSGCGGSYADFRQTGRLGCADCWRLYEPALRVLLRRYHGSTRHLGRAPIPRTEGVLRAERATLLQERLRQAVEHEDFEQAARLRDQLRELE